MKGGKTETRTLKCLQATSAGRGEFATVLVRVIEISLVSVPAPSQSEAAKGNQKIGPQYLEVRVLIVYPDSCRLQTNCSRNTYLAAWHRGCGVSDR